MAQKPKIITPEGGFHNRDLEQSRTRLLKGATYRDASTICVIPTRGLVHARVLQSWFNLMTPMNQKFTRLFATNMEVGQAYTAMIEMVLANPVLATWKYLLTLEEDNTPPPDGLIRLIQSMAESDYAAIGGLYWTKGPGGQPMIYGDPNEMPKNFRPQPPVPNSLQHCLGLGMGFTLFRIEMFKDERIPRPWFKTEQSYQPGVGARAYTQDLYFFENAGAVGYKFACDTRVLVGHYDLEGDQIW
jgi:hypothetical protein